MNYRNWLGCLAWLLVTGCGESGGKTNGNGGDSGALNPDSAVAFGAEAIELHYFHDKAWKVAAHEGRVLVTTQHGEDVWSWDPVSEQVSEYGRDLGDVQGAVGWMGAVWVTHSISGVEGSISQLTPPNSLALVATATPEGELMRRPLEMAPLAGQLAIADLGGPRVWTLSPDASTVEAIETPEVPLTLAAHGDSLFIGTDGGVFQREGGTWSQIDDRPAYGLAWHGEELLAVNAAQGLFVAGVPGHIGLEGPARPGSMVVLGEALFFVDEVGGSLWTLSPVP